MEASLERISRRYGNGYLNKRRDGIMVQTNNSYQDVLGKMTTKVISDFIRMVEETRNPPS
jgi:hypothetical protein